MKNEPITATAKRQAKLYLTHEALALLADKAHKEGVSMSVLVDLLIKDALRPETASKLQIKNVKRNKNYQPPARPAKPEEFRIDV